MNQHSNVKIRVVVKSHYITECEYQPRSAAALFASDMEIGSELALTGHGEPHDGCDQSTLAVSLARLKSKPIQSPSLSEG